MSLYHSWSFSGIAFSRGRRVTIDRVEMKECEYDQIRGVAPFLLAAAADLVLFYLLIAIGVTWQTGHVVSFLGGAAVICIIWALRPLAHVPMPIQGGMYPILGFAVLQLLALFLRGGAIAALVELVGLSPMTAIILAVGVSLAVTLAGTYSWLLQENGRREQAPWWRNPILIAITYALALRLLYSGTFELLHEEAYYWNYAQHLDLAYLDHPPMVAWLIWVFTMLLGHGEFGVRVGSLLSWVVTAYCSYKLVDRACGPATAFRTLLLVAVLPVFFGAGIIMTPDAPLMACWAGTLYYLCQSLIEGRRWSWLGVGIFTGLGMLSKYTFALLGAATLVFMVMDREARRWFFRPEPYLAVVLAFGLFSPVLIWNAEHQWASFAFQAAERFRGNFDFDLFELIGSILVLLTPTGLLTAVATLASRESILPKLLDTKKERTLRFLLTSTVVPLSFFVCFSLFRDIRLNWTGPIWLGILPYMAAFLLPGRPETAARLPRYVSSAWPATIVVLLFLYGAALHYTVLGFPGVPYFEKPLRIGMPDLARQIEAIEADFERRAGEKPFTVCMDSDRLAGLIAFYRAKMAGSGNEAKVADAVRNTTGGHLFGKRSHMYRYWHPRGVYRDRTLLIIGLQHSDLLERRVTSQVRAISDIERIVVEKNGKPTGHFFYQFAKIRRGKVDLRNMGSSLQENTVREGISNAEPDRE